MKPCARNWLASNGSLYRTSLRFHKTWKTSTKPFGNFAEIIIDMAADRGAFICQSQSLNIHYRSKLANWPPCTSTPGRRFKTGMYYLRSNAAMMPSSSRLISQPFNSLNKKEVAVAEPVAGYAITEVVQPSLYEPQIKRCRHWTKACRYGLLYAG